MQSVSMSQGSSVVLGGRRLRVVITWSPTPHTPTVRGAMLLTDAGRVRDEEDLVYRNRRVHKSGAVEHHGQDTRRNGVRVDEFDVDLAAVESDIDAIAIVATADGPFSDVDGLTVHLVTERDVVLARYAVSGATSEMAYVLGEIRRRRGDWEFTAVGRGYDSGSEGLTAEYGADADEAEAPVIIQDSIRPLPGEERLPADMRQRLDTRRQMVADTLRAQNVPGRKARVILVLDASASMETLYKKGIVGRLVERLAAVSAQLDPGAVMEAFIFATNSARLPDLHLGDMPAWIRLHARLGNPKVLEPGQIDMRRLGFSNEEHRVIRSVRRFVEAEPVPMPTFVLFCSDGSVHKDREIEKELRAAAAEPIYWQFIGLGDADFGMLERFDTLPGRDIDNTGFFAVSNVDKMPDRELYDKVLEGLPTWAREARALRILARRPVVG